MNTGAEVNKGVFVVVIAVVVILVCFLGYRYLSPSASVDAKTRQMYMQRMNTPQPYPGGQK